MKYSGKELAAKLRVCPDTVSHWRLHGVRGVKLHGTAVGGRWYYRGQDVKAFLQALQKGEEPSPPVKPDLLGHEAAKVRLRVLGIDV